MLYPKRQIGVYSSTQKKSKGGEKGSLKSKPPFRFEPKVLNGFKFIPTCHHCGVIGHISLQCHKLKREQNQVARSIPKKLSGPKHIVCHHCGAFGHLRPQCSKFHAFIRIKRKEKKKLRFLEVVLKAVNQF